MRRRDVGLISSTLLLPAVVFLAATGLVSDFMDLNEFVYHKYTGFLSVGLVALHVYVHWPQLTAFWKRKVTRKAQAGAGPVPSRRSPASDQPAPRPKTDHQGGGQWPAQMTRRDVLQLAGAGVAGLLLGWLIRQPDEAISAADQDLGELYHRWSTPGYADALSAILNWGRQPPPYKDYAWAEHVSLPPVESPPLTLAEAVARRRSLRDYAARPLTLGELSWLLYAASGITAPAGLRAAPSAGAQFPIETYVVANRIEGLASGLYHYAVAEHALERLKSGDLRAAVMRAGLAQEFLAQAGVVFALTALFQRLRWRYRERTYRYALLEAGHIGQNIYLAAEAAGLGACAVGAYFDDDVNQLLDVDGVREATLYLLAVGPR